jgi:hypothetical protein
LSVAGTSNVEEKSEEEIEALKATLLEAAPWSVKNE